MCEQELVGCAQEATAGTGTIKSQVKPTTCLECDWETYKNKVTLHHSVLGYRGTRMRVGFQKNTKCLKWCLLYGNGYMAFVLGIDYKQ